MPIPYLTLAKWAGVGLLVLALFAAIGVAVHRVDSWHRDSLALPQVSAKLDQAVKDRDAANQAKEKQAVMFAGTLTDLTAAIVVLQDKYDALAKNQAADAAAAGRALAHFKEMTANVSPNAAPGSPDDVLVRRELLNLLANPDTGRLDRGGAGDGKSQAGADVPGTASQFDQVPGRSGAAPDERGAVVPATGKAGRSGAKRSAQGRRRRSARVGKARTKQSVPARRLGPAVPGSWVVAASDGFAIASRRIPRRGGGYAFEAVVRYGERAGDQVARYCGVARG